MPPSGPLCVLGLESDDWTKAALKSYGISYPVAQDNGSKTWNAYRNQNLAGATHHRPKRKDRIPA